MDIPVTGYLLIPLGLVAAGLPWGYALIALTVFAMMPAAAVINTGGIGLQPGFYMAILLVARTAVQIMLRGFRLNGFVLARMWPLFAFTAAALIALFIGLCFFQGKVDTLPGSSGFKSVAAHPFQLAKENYAQLGYLMANLSLVYVMGHQAVRRPIRELAADWDRALVAALCFSIFVCTWQFAGLYAGMPFPAEFFYSNAGYGRAEGQTMGGLFRINGPFGEPSALGYYFTGFLMFAIARLQTHFTPFTVLAVAACVMCILISTSTTAYVGLFFCFCYAMYDIGRGRIPILPRRLGLTKAHVTMIAVVLLVVAAATIVVLTNLPAIEVIVRNTILNKDQSTSYQQRSYADAMALDIFAKTLGLGLGLGSHKANNLVFTLLANAGLAGLLFFCIFLFTVLRPVASRPGEGHGFRLGRAMLPFRRGLIGLILIHLVSAPNLGVLVLWAQLGGLLALEVALTAASARARVRAVPHGLEPPLVIKA
jgi:hypothetical protein